jgi:pyruvate dehydrogenase E1 component alpha subunit
MPRKALDLDLGVDHLSILGPDGKVDTKLEPDIDDDLLVDMYRGMVRSRLFDERMLNLQRQGKLGTFAPVKGQEASQIGTAAVLRQDDWVVPSFREASVSIWRGATMDSVLLFAAGYNEGLAIPDDLNDMPIAVPVGSQILHGVGIGYGIVLDGGDQVVMTYFGDGATSEGDFHEALNFAGVLKTPVIFLNQNNSWAISTPRSIQSASSTLAQKALAYGLPGIQVDGNDILAVYVAAQEAVERARKDGTATLIECLTYRMEVHTTADDPKRYREDEAVAEWEKKDPILRFEKYLTRRKLLNKKAIEETAKEIKAEIDEAWKKTQAQIEKLDDPSVMFDHHYDQRPPYLERQRAAFTGEGGGNG